MAYSGTTTAVSGNTEIISKLNAVLTLPADSGRGQPRRGVWVQIEFARVLMGRPGVKQISHGLPQSCEVKSAADVRHAAQVTSISRLQPAGTLQITATKVFKGHGDLNEALIEMLFRIGRVGQAAPDVFPGFMGGKKLAGIEQGDAAEMEAALVGGREWDALHAAIISCRSGYEFICSKLMSALLSFPRGEETFD